MHVMIIFREGVNLISILERIPILHRSNGSLVHMKNSLPWMGFSNVTQDELKILKRFYDNYKIITKNPKIVKIKYY